MSTHAFESYMRVVVISKHFRLVRSEMVAISVTGKCLSAGRSIRDSAKLGKWFQPMRL